MQITFLLQVVHLQSLREEYLVVGLRGHFPRHWCLVLQAFYLSLPCRVSHRLLQPPPSSQQNCNKSPLCCHLIWHPTISQLQPPLCFLSLLYMLLASMSLGTSIASLSNSTSSAVCSGTLQLDAYPQLSPAFLPTSADSIACCGTLYTWVPYLCSLCCVLKLYGIFSSHISMVIENIHKFTWMAHKGSCVKD